MEWLLRVCFFAPFPPIADRLRLDVDAHGDTTRTVNADGDDIRRREARYSNHSYRSWFITPDMAYSDEELLEDIRSVADVVERSPSLQDYRNHGEYAASTIYRRFGSWQDAVDRAGFEPHDPETKIAENELFAELHRLADELGEIPTTTQMNEHGRYWSKVYRDRFGSWGEALEAAGFDTAEINDRIDRVSREMLLDELERLADETNGTPTVTQLRENGTHAPETYRQEFGSWNAAIEAIGHEPRDRSPVTEEELIDELHRLAETLGERPKSTDIIEQGEHSLATYQRRFGSWSAALEAAGFDPDDRRPTDDELVADLRRLHAELDKVPSLPDVDEHGAYSGSTYQRRFGSWSEALEAAGFDSDRGPTDEELLADLRRLREELDKHPSLRDVTEHGEYGGTTYQRRFGSWSAALEAAFDDADDADTA